MTAALGIDMAMKNIIYELYSKDLSVKVRSARQSLYKKGEYIAPFAIYGYTNKVEKKRLVIDPYAAEVVKRMFEYAVNGETAREIAIRLNNDGVLPPNAYNKSKSTGKMHYIPMDTAAIWTGDVVRRIIQDERYTGKMVCGKYRRPRGGKITLVPKSDWVVTPGTHEAIVTDEIYKKAQEVFRVIKEKTPTGIPKSILTGTLKCAHCNSSLVASLRFRRYFYCHNQNMGLGCEQASVDEQVLIDVIFTAIKVKLALVQSAETSAVTGKHGDANKREAERRECENRLKKLKLAQTALLEQYLDGKLSKDGFQLQKAQTTAAIQEAAGQLTALEAMNDNYAELVESHKPFFNQESLTREMVKGLIKEIRVILPDEIEIVWRFQEHYNHL